MTEQPVGLPDHPQTRLLLDLMKDLDNEVEDLDAFCAREKIEKEVLLKVSTHRLISVLEAIVDAAEGEPDPMAKMIWAGWQDGFAVGYLFALSRPDEP